MPQNNCETEFYDLSDITKRVRIGLTNVPTGTTVVLEAPASSGTISLGGGGGGSAVNTGLATIPFASWLNEDSVAVTGQSALTSGSRIWACVVADSGEVALERWESPVIKSVIAGTGFTISLRPSWLTHKGAVKIHWGWV